MNQLRLTLVLLLIASTGWSQGVIPMGARSNALANASVALEDVWSYHHNPAGLSDLKSIEVGVSYENRYLLPAFQNQGVVLVAPLKKGVISVGAQLHGYRLYRSNRIGLGYSMRLSEKFSAGVQVNYHSLRIENYGTAGTATGEFGFQAKINSKVTLGASVSNIGRNQLIEIQNDRYSTYLRLGLSYKLSERVLTLLEAEKEIESRLRVKGAVEYQLIEQFYFRLGAASNPVEVTSGFGIQFKTQWKLDFGMGWHQQLGISPNIGMSYAFKSKKNVE